MKESIFQTEVKYSIIEQGGWCEKFPDMPKFPGQSRFIPTKPFDLIGIWDSIPFAIECKMSTTYKAFAQTEMRNKQSESLDKFQEAGGYSFIFLNVRSNRKIKPYRNNLIILPWTSLKEMWKLGSIKKPNLMEMDVVKGKLKRFNMDTLYHLLSSEMSEDEEYAKYYTTYNNFIKPGDGFEM